MGKMSNLPKLGEFMYGMNNDFVRKFTLKSTFLFNKEIITEEFYEQLTRFHKIEGSTDVIMYVTRMQFFDRLSEGISVLGSMGVPTLIVWGRNEKSIRLSIGEELARKLMASQMEILNHAGHCSTIDQYKQFNILVLDFLRPF